MIWFSDFVMPGQKNRKKTKKKMFYLGNRHYSCPTHGFKQAHPLDDPPPPPPTTHTHTLTLNHHNHQKKKKKESFSERRVAQIGEGMSRFSMGFQQKAQGAEIFCFCLSFKWVWWAWSCRLRLSQGSWSLVRIDLHHLGGAVHAWENKIRDKRTKGELL